MTETPDPQHIGDILRTGPPIGETDADAAYVRKLQDLQSEKQGLQAARYHLAEEALLSDGDPGVDQALQGLTSDQVATQADIVDHIAHPPITPEDR